MMTFELELPPNFKPNHSWKRTLGAKLSYEGTLYPARAPASCFYSPTTNEMNNLNVISIVKFCGDPISATNNLAVDFNCQPHGWKFELVDHLIQ